MVVANASNVITHEPADVYHAKRSEYLSSHQLADFRKCPLLYHRKKTGSIAEEDRPAYMIGRAAHTLILEGLDRFEEDFAVGGPVNPKTGQPFGSDTKAWAEWAEAIGQTRADRRSVRRRRPHERIGADARGRHGPARIRRAGRRRAG